MRGRGREEISRKERTCLGGGGERGFPYSARGRRYMKTCHIAKVEVWALLVETVTSSTGPKHFQMSANSITGAASMCKLMSGKSGGRRRRRRRRRAKTTADCKGEE